MVKTLMFLDTSKLSLIKAIKLMPIMEAENKVSATFEASRLRLTRRKAVNLAHIVLYTVLLNSSRYMLLFF